MVASITRIIWYVEASRADIYRALLDARAVTNWMVPAGMTGHVHEFDAREGGRFRVSLTYASPTGTGKTTMHTDTYLGRFVELVPDERVEEELEFETDNPAMRNEMRVAFTLLDADGGTDVLAVHENALPGVTPADNEAGWRIVLGKLARLVEAGRKT